MLGVTLWMSNPASIEQRLQRRLVLIQDKYNFNPEWGALQICNVDDRDVRRAHAEFSFIIETLSKSGATIQIPYDPAGLTPTEHLKKRMARPQYVYFARLLTKQEWKVGTSHDPTGRCRHLSTGNRHRLEPKYRIEGGKVLEGLVHAYLDRYKTRDGGGQEWFYAVDEALVRSLIERIRREGPAFLARERA